MIVASYWYAKTEQRIRIGKYETDTAQRNIEYPNKQTRMRARMYDLLKVSRIITWWYFSVIYVFDARYLKFKLIPYLISDHLCFVFFCPQQVTRSIVTVIHHVVSVTAICVYLNTDVFHKSLPTRLTREAVWKTSSWLNDVFRRRKKHSNGWIKV